MLDELLDMFDRDSRHGSHRKGQQRGVRGMLGRFLGNDDEERSDRRYHDDDDDFERRPGDRRGHRRERDPFDFDE